jgi:tetratricopeptide (TPR) repeat protein
VHECGLRVKLIVAGVVLTWLLGCQSDKQHTTPGALPTSPTVDATPRLNATTYFAHAHLLERQGNFEQAAEQYRQALALTPNFVSARNRLGITLNKLGQHTQASAEYKLAVQSSPGDAYLHNNLGFSLYLEGRYDEAVAALDRAIELRPEFQRAHMNRGVALARLGRFDETLCEFSLATAPADAHYNLALIQTEMGQYAAAVRSLESVLQIDSNHELARQQLRVVSRLVAEVEDATTNQASLAEVAPAPTAAPASPAEVALPGELDLASDVQTEVQVGAETEVQAEVEMIGTFPPAPPLPAEPQPDLQPTADQPVTNEAADTGAARAARTPVTFDQVMAEILPWNPAEIRATVGDFVTTTARKLHAAGNALLAEPGPVSVKGEPPP